MNYEETLEKLTIFLQTKFLFKDNIKKGGLEIVTSLSSSCRIYSEKFSFQRLITWPILKLWFKAVSDLFQNNLYKPISFHLHFFQFQISFQIWKMMKKRRRITKIWKPGVERNGFRWSKKHLYDFLNIFLW